jgi:hypothetical protein
MKQNPFRWLAQHQKYVLTAILTVLLIGCFSHVPQTGQAAATVRSADAFVDSIGVATHLRYADTAYGRYADVIKPRLQELGVRHIRDGGQDPLFFQKLNDLAETGIRATLVMDPRDGITPGNVVSVITPILAAVDSVEGPNEWDVQNQLNYKGQAFPTGIRTYQTELYSAIKGNNATVHLPVLMPSLANPFNAPQLGFLNTLDAGNMHSYAGGNMPSQDLDSKWIPLTRNVSGANKPIVASETGWHTAISDPGASQPGVSEQVAAKYIPRLFLEYFNRDIRRAFVYELMDERPAPNQENNFGLLHADGTPKPAFVALKNLITLLKDPGPPFQPTALSYRVDGISNTVHQTALQKRDGKYYIILWQEVPSFNLASKAELAIPNQSATLTLNTPFRLARIYQPLNSPSPVTQISNPTQISLNVPDHPLVVELLPS